MNPFQGQPIPQPNIVTFCYQNALIYSESWKTGVPREKALQAQESKHQMWFGFSDVKGTTN